jgi:hypothetical protein
LAKAISEPESNRRDGKFVTFHPQNGLIKNRLSDEAVGAKQTDPRAVLNAAARRSVNTNGRLPKNLDGINAQAA